MKKSIKPLAAIILLLSSLQIESVLSAPMLQHSGRPSPDVSFEKVQEVFGYNLDTEDTLLKTLLLAVAMDHTSSDSPNGKENIGIPFIVDRGPNYWVSRLKNGDREIEVVVNNAILLLFTKENIPNARKAAINLMRIASDRGYWPAEYFIAEVNLDSQLSIDYSKPTPLTGKISGEKSRLAKSTMDTYNSCAEIGFAPCQFRIGFWLVNSPGSTSDGLNVLRHAISTTLNDSRYLGVMDTSIVLAGAEIAQKGEAVGIDSVIRQEYGDLSNKYLIKIKGGSK